MTGELKLEGDLQISCHRAVSWPLCRADGLQGEVSVTSRCGQGAEGMDVSPLSESGAEVAA